MEAVTEIPVTLYTPIMSLSIELAMEVLESQEVTESMREKAKMVIRETRPDGFLGGLAGMTFQPPPIEPPTLREWLATPMMQEWLSLHALPQLPAESEGAPKETE